MRSFLAALLGLGVPISIGYVVACGPPSSFDHITGGPVPPDAVSDAPTGPPLEDKTLDPPRPIAPLSGSWVNGLRPHFRWDLPALDGRGAQVVVCEDRQCSDPAKTISWNATGRDLVPPDDLPPGRYFWHLVATTPSTIGTRSSATWTLIVRGGKGDGIPAGQITDMNGDGIADLFFNIDVNVQGSTYHDSLLLLGSSATDATQLALGIDRPELQPRDFASGATANERIQTTDINGDGFSDVIFSDLALTTDGGTKPQGFFFAVPGAADLASPDVNVFARPLLPELDVLPASVAPGDIDGDGYGDMVVGTKKSAFAVYGGTKGLTTFSTLDRLLPFVDKDAGQLDPPTTAIAVGAFDFNGDGMVDPVEASYGAGEGFLYFQAGPNRSFDLPTIFVDNEADSGNPFPAPAISFANGGDFDGDGKADLAFATAVAGKASICVTTNASGMQGKLICYTPPAPPNGYGQSLIALDLEGDGKDEIVVASAVAGLEILRLTAPDKLEGESLANDYGVGLTVLDPGATQKPAVWVAVRPDGAGFGVFRGKDLAAPFGLKDLAFTADYPILRVGPSVR